MRKFIIKYYSGHYTCNIFKIKITALKCTRIMFPYFVIMGIISCIPPTDILNWYDILLLIGFIFQVWLTFPLFGIGYFELYPTKWEEMDDYNKFLFGFHFPERLNIEQKKYYKKLFTKYYL
jgi:hypothetical protein